MTDEPIPLVSVRWNNGAEHVEGTADHSILVLPDAEGAHRIYWSAPTMEHFAQLVSVPIAMALDSGAWPLACKIVRDNYDSGGYRMPAGVSAPTWAVDMSRTPISAASRMVIDAYGTAIAAGARSQDGSHATSIINAQAALVRHVRRLERLAGRR
jgi:hypothetical protein